MSKYDIDTDFGPISLTPTSGEHVHASFEALVVNRVEYRGGAHLHLWSDGVWRIGKDGSTPFESYQSLHVTRSNWTRVSEMDASQSARKKLVAEFEEVVNYWASETPGALDAAAREDWERDLVSAQKKVTEAYDALQAARANFDAVSAREPK